MKILKINQNKKGNNSNIIDEKMKKEVSSNNTYNHSFAVAIIGGGFAGLSAALLLGRYLRPVIIFDVRKHRKYNIHGYLGFEKASIGKAIQKSWKNVSYYNSIKKVKEEN
jgi:monoamine oxidase